MSHNPLVNFSGYHNFTQSFNYLARAANSYHANYSKPALFNQSDSLQVPSFQLQIIFHTQYPIEPPMLINLQYFSPFIHLTTLKNALKQNQIPHWIDIENRGWLDRVCFELHDHMQGMYTEITDSSQIRPGSYIRVTYRPEIEAPYEFPETCYQVAEAGLESEDTRKDEPQEPEAVGSPKSMRADLTAMRATPEFVARKPSPATIEAPKMDDKVPVVPKMDDQPPEACDEKQVEREPVVLGDFPPLKMPSNLDRKTLSVDREVFKPNERSQLTAVCDGENGEHDAVKVSSGDDFASMPMMRRPLVKRRSPSPEIGFRKPKVAITYEATLDVLKFIQERLLDLLPLYTDKWTYIYDNVKYKKIFSSPSHVKEWFEFTYKKYLNALQLCKCEADAKKAFPFFTYIDNHFWALLIDEETLDQTLQLKDNFQY
ncbi:hypothetical protein HDE_12510 [Halotydeus destructor]|nr:hypothetical protein HDE_12510 [Halotydeus destructor]